MMTDQIADMLTRIRNGLQVKRGMVEMPSSKMKVELARVLKEEGFILDYEVVPPEQAQAEGTRVKVQPVLRIYLKYGPHGERVITELKRISKPGRRVYMKVQDLKPVVDGMGIRILSTSRGVLSDRQARKLRVGGEVLCEVY